MSNLRKAIFLGGGLILCLLVILLPAGALYKDVLALVLAAIALLAIYPVRRK